MAYTTGQTAAQVVTAVQGATGNSTFAPAADAINNMLSGLANAQPPYPAIGSPVLFANVLVKCTTGFTFGSATQPVYAYDTAPA